MSVAPGARLPVEVTALGDREARARWAPRSADEVEAVRGLPDDVRALGGVPGDRGELVVARVGQHAVFGRLDPQTLAPPSPDRVSLPCDVADRCGGCPWMAVSPVAQRAAKRAALTAHLEATLGEDVAAARWHPWVVGAASLGFRTRALYRVAVVGGRLRLGFFAPRTNALVPAEGCVVHHPMLAEVAETLRAGLARSGLSVWRGAGDRHDGGRPGVLRAILLRVDPQHASAGVVVTVVVSEGSASVRSALRSLGDCPGVAGVALNVQPAEGGAVLGSQTVPLSGARTQPMAWGDGPTLEVGPTAFVQTHHAAADAMVRAVLAQLPERLDHALDLYGGVGTFAFALAGRASRVTTVERHAGASESAAREAARLGLGDRVVVRGGDAAEVVPALAMSWEGGPPDAVVLDPPRAGCADAVLDVVSALPGAPTVVYVSCGPRSLARDLSRLRARGGFRLQDVVPVEMFPHSSHQETVAVLTRAAPAGRRRPNRP